MAERKQKKKKAGSKAKKEPESLADLAFPQHLEENKVIAELRETVERLKLFDSLGKTLTSVLDLNEILRLVVNELSSLVGSRHLGLVLCNSSEQTFYFQHPSPSGSQDKKHFSFGTGLIGQTIERGKAQLFINPSKQPDFDKNCDYFVLDNASSMICQPIISKGSVLGAVVFLSRKDEKALTESHLRALEGFNDYLAIAVENASNYQKVQELTITDDLTRLYNSRYLPVVLERELARSRRYEEDLSVVFIDLDNFKQVNDRYGHLAGSALLTEFGNFLHDRIRTTDVGIRYGGDEFVLVLPRTGKKDAVQVVERTLEELRKHPFLESRHLKINLTASFGIATFPEDAENIDGIIAAADRAMYEVKKSHKNGVWARGVSA